jgi:hypothetical protein
MGVCADALDAEKKAGTGPGLVSIHAIVSAGMKIEPKHVRVPPGGSAILADGLGAGAVQSVELHNPPMGAHVHKARSDEARAAVGDAAVEALARARGYAAQPRAQRRLPGPRKPHDHRGARRALEREGR